MTDAPPVRDGNVRVERNCCYRMIETWKHGAGRTAKLSELRERVADKSPQ